MSNEIEVKLVIDSEQLNAKFDTPEFGNAVEQVFRDRSSFVADLKGALEVPDVDDIQYDIINGSDLEYAIEAGVENWVSNSDLYYLSDTVDDLQRTIEEWDVSQMQEDLNELTGPAIDAINDRLHTFRDRLDTVEDKLSAEPEDSGNSVAMLVLRVERLEEINKRLMHIISNVQGEQLT